MPEGPYKLPSGWRWVRLGEVVDVKQGRAISTKKLQKDGYPVFGANGLIGFWKEYHYKEEQVLIACRGSTCGIVNMSLPYSFVNNNAMALVILNEDKLFKKYLFYVLHYSYLVGQIGSVISGSGQPQITKSALEEYLISLPPLSEQRRIVARIEELISRVREARRLREEAYKDADRLWQSTLAEVFPRPGQDLPSSWRWVRLGEVVDIKQGRAISTKKLQKDGYPVFGANGLIGFWKEYHYKEEQVLIACRGSTCGIVNMSLPYSFVNNNAMALVILNEDKLFKKYLFYVLHYSYLVGQIGSVISGSGQPQITKSALGEYLIPLPPLEEQHRIVAYLDEVQSKIAALKKRQEETTTELNRLEQAILDRAFRGEL